jgi:O-antigen ligase
MIMSAPAVSVHARPHTGRQSMIPTVVVVGPIAWGVVLFGAVYPWTYLPLVAAITLVGAYGWIQAAPPERHASRGVAIGLAAVAAVVVFQLIPLSGDLLARISPATDAFLRQYNVAFAIARAQHQPLTHPLSVAPGATLRGLMFLLSLGVFTIGCTSMLPNLSLTRVVNQLIVLAFVMAIFGVVQKATFNDRIYWFWKPINVANNAFGPFVNRNHFAGWMLMMSALTAGYLRGLLSPALRAPIRSWRDRAGWLSSVEASRTIWVAAALFVMVLSIVWSFSRSGIASTAVAGAMLGAHATVRKRGRGSLLGVWFVLTALAVAVIWRGTGDVTEWYSRTNTLQWRVEQWRDTWPIVRDFPWFGTGLNTYAVSLLLYPTSHPESIVNQAHNDYLQVLSEGGVLLGAAALGLFAWVVYGVRRAFAAPQSVKVYWIRVGAVIGMAAIAVQECVDFSLQMPGNAVLFAFLLSVALHLPRGLPQPRPADAFGR